MKKLGYVTTTEYQKLEMANGALSVRLTELQQENTDLKLQVHSAPVKDFIPCDLLDPSPTEVVERKAYVAKVAGFFQDVFNKKIYAMISASHTLLEDESLTEKQSDKILGSIYSLREFLHWGKTMLNEHLSYIQESKEQITEEEINNIK